MGLDMWLNREKYIGGKYGMASRIIDIYVDNKKIPVDLNKVAYIEEQVAYWRKANQIHNWFIKNCANNNEDSNSMWVSIEDLIDLLEKCKEVKKKAILEEGQIVNGQTLKDGKWVNNLVNGKYIKNSDEIREILPCVDGFFFGSTEYDEYYMQDIEYTIEVLEEILDEEKEYNKNGIYCEYKYEASW